MNKFETRANLCKNIGIAGIFMLLISLAASLYLGLGILSDSDLIVIPVLLCVFSIFPVTLGFVFQYMYKVYLRIAKLLFSDEEIQAITKPMLLNMYAAEKAKRLLVEGRAKGDMTEFNDFRDLAMLSMPRGTYGSYNGII